MKAITFISTVVLAGAIVACAAETKAPATTPTEPAAAAPAGTNEAECTPGETRCEGSYLGTTAEGNDPPAGANTEVCDAGKWTAAESCDAAANLGCYVVEEPATGDMVARCLDTYSPGE